MAGRDESNKDGTIMRIAKLLNILVVAAACLLPLDSWATQPGILFQREVYDLGKVPLGRKVTAHFPFSNMGDGTLVIQAIKADCDCTEAYNTNPDVPPRGRSQIVMVLDTASLRPGRNERHVHVRSNDPQRPSVTLTMVVDVMHE